MRKLLQLLTTLLLLIFLLPWGVMAQQRNISGTVSAENQNPLEGVTITVKNTNRVTQTDSSGHFSIRAATGENLIITYTGYGPQELKVPNGSVVSATLRVSGNSLSEVVVTAFGIKRERKALGYSVSELSAQELMKNKNTNVVNSLAGKVPGVNVTQFSGAPGAGASITIRGGNSTSDGRQNQPLFVVDGVIYDNSTSVTGNSGTDGLTRSNTTYSNRVMDINPEDIESLSVLKGAAAAALYGSRAADGVIIITTKRGVEGKVTVSANSKISSSWANKLPEVQTTFGPGSYATNGVLNTTTYSSFGPKIPGDSTIYDNIGGFFRRGIVYDNNVNVSGGSKNGSFYLSGSNFKQTGIVPGTDYNKTTFRFNGEQKYGRLTLNANAAYSIANTNRTLTTSGLYGSGTGSMQSLYGFPQTYDIKNYINPDGTQHRIYAGVVDLQNDIDNPYWIINQDKLTSKTSRFTGSINGNFKVTEWWDITARLGYDQYSTNDYTYI